jgi:hypothetical protein
MTPREFRWLYIEWLKAEDEVDFRFARLIAMVYNASPNRKGDQREAETFMLRRWPLLTKDEQQEKDAQDRKLTAQGWVLTLRKVFNC